MKILVAGEFPQAPPTAIGGIQAVTWQLTSTLSQMKETEVDVFSYEKWWEPHADGRAWNKAYGALMAHYGTSPKALPHVLSTWSTDAWATRRMARRLRPDVVHAHGQTGYAVGALTARLPAVITVHGILAVEKRATDYGGIRARLREATWRATEDWCLRNAKDVIVISPYVGDAIRPRTGARLHAVPNPVSEEFFSLNHPRAPGRAWPQVLTIGWLSARKRHDLTLRAFKQVSERHSGARLRIVGSPPPRGERYLRFMQDMVRDLGLGDRVDFLGRISQHDLLREYASATLLVHAAEEESSPMVIAQALASGVPVVAMDIPGVRHLVVPAVTGERARNGDPEHLGSVICALLSNSGTTATLSKTARAHAKRNFSARAVATHTLDVYETARMKQSRSPSTGVGRRLG